MSLDRRTFLRRSAAVALGLYAGDMPRLGVAASTADAAAETAKHLALRELDLAPLFTPFTLGPCQTKNRFVMAPMSVGDYRDGVPTDAVADHYERRAAGGVGLIITGGTIVDHPLGAAEINVGRMNDRTAEAWKRVVARVHAHGARVFCQLWHQGPLSRPGLGPRPVVERGVKVVNEASQGDLRAVIDAFARSARRVREAGFDGVEIHGAHGYLLDAYLRVYGARVPTASDVRPETFVPLLVRTVREAVGPRFPIGFRFSRWTNAGSPGRYLADPEALARVLLPLRDVGVDAFHASRGYGPFWPPEYADSPLTLAGWCRRLTGKPTITVGHVGLDPRSFFGEGDGSLSTLLAQLAAGQFELVAVGRALLKNPDWVALLQRRAYATLIEAGAAD